MCNIPDEVNIIHIYDGSSENSTYIEHEVNDKTILLNMAHFISRHGVEIIDVFKKRIKSKACNSNGIRIMKSAS